MRAALYARVSTDDQAVEGFSLDAQIKRLEAYCRVRGWEIAGEYRDEGFSGRNTRRPEYDRMMRESDTWDVLLVLKMDRIHRNSVNFTHMMDQLHDMGKEFNSVQEKFDTTTAMGRFVMDIMQRIAQLESEQIGERTYMGMEFKARNGTGTLGSGHPYGYVYTAEGLEVVKDEAHTVRAIYNMYIRRIPQQRRHPREEGREVEQAVHMQHPPQSALCRLHGMERDHPSRGAAAHRRARRVREGQRPDRAKPIMRAAIYVRVSTEEQASEGYSIGAQTRYALPMTAQEIGAGIEEMLQDYCIVEGWEVAGVYEDDGYSGRSVKRPAY